MKGEHSAGVVEVALDVRQQVKWVLLTWVMLCGFALVDSAIGLIWLRRLLNGLDNPRIPVMALGVLLRLLGWGAISLYAYRFLRRARLAVYIACYVLLGLTGGLMLFAVRGALFTWFIVAQQKAVIFDFFTCEHLVGLTAAGVVICGSTGVISRAVDAYREGQRN